MTDTRSNTAGSAPTGRDGVLCIGKRFYTNKDTLLEQFGRVYRLPELWAAEGARVLLWLVDYHGRLAVEKHDASLRILSAPVFSLASIRALATALRFRPRTVLASGDCYVGLLGWLLARVSGARFVFDIYDKYDEFAGYRRILGFDLFAFLRRRADLQFFCSRGLRDSYAGESATAATAVVPNGVDVAVFAPKDLHECRRTLGLPAEDLIFGYFGSMEPDRGVEDLLAAVHILRSEGVDAKLLVCGKASTAIALDSDWIEFRGMVPHAEMPDYLNACDLLVVPYRESPIMDMGASCKIAEYMMCGRPLVSTSTGNFTFNFPTQAEELGPGLCRPGDVSAMVRSMRFQLTERRVLSQPADMGWDKIAAVALAAIHAQVEASR